MSDASSRPNAEPSRAADAEAEPIAMAEPWWAPIVRRERQTSYRYTRFFLLRLLGLLYLMGFLILDNQAVALIGHHGLLPADAFVHRVVAGAGLRRDAFWELPTVFDWIAPTDTALRVLAGIGTGLSLLVLFGFANAIVRAACGRCTCRSSTSGSLWYGYGWEIQLLETGFLAIFLAEPLDPRPIPARDAPKPVVWLYRWLIFRIMLGAGLIKLRGDPCWRELTCLYYALRDAAGSEPAEPTLPRDAARLSKGGRPLQLLLARLPYPSSSSAHGACVTSRAASSSRSSAS